MIDVTGCSLGDSSGCCILRAVAGVCACRGVDGGVGVVGVEGEEEGFLRRFSEGEDPKMYLPSGET